MPPEVRLIKMLNVTFEVYHYLVALHTTTDTCLTEGCFTALGVAQAVLGM